MGLSTAVMTEPGLVLCSDTRVNAGIDNISTYRKLFGWDRPGHCVVFLQPVGNFALAQKTTAKIGDLVASAGTPIGSLSEVGDRVGEMIRQNVESMQRERGDIGSLAALLSGQCIGERPRIFLIYPEGNMIEATDDTPFLSLGEHKYGKPLLDAGHDRAATLDQTLRLVLGAFELTLRSNLSVGLPLDHAVYRAGDLRLPEVTRLGSLPQDSLVTDYLRQFFSGTGGAIPNPTVSARGTSYFATLEELDRILEELKQHIRGINDPDRLVPHVQAARAFATAFQGFLDVHGTHPPEEIPTEIKGGLIKALRRVNWAQVSDQAQKWVARILQIVSGL